MVKEDYSLFEFKQLPFEVQAKYLQLAREKSKGLVSDIVLEVIAANLWLEDMKEKEEGRQDE